MNGDTSKNPPVSGDKLARKILETKRELDLNGYTEKERKDYTEEVIQQVVEGKKFKEV